MKSKFQTRVLSWLLVFLLLIGSYPHAAAAEDLEPDVTSTAEVTDGNNDPTSTPPGPNENADPETDPPEYALRLKLDPIKKTVYAGIKTTFTLRLETDGPEPSGHVQFFIEAKKAANVPVN